MRNITRYAGTACRNVSSHPVVVFSFLLAGIFTAAIFSQIRKDYQKLAWPVNTANGDRSPTISADGNVLIFESDRDGSLGSYDLYESRWEGGHWSKPINLTALNSRFYDGYPQLSYDNQILYFSSNRSLNDSNNKDLDIWVSRRNLQGIWQAPQTVKELNSDRHDSNVNLSFDRNEVFFCSGRKGGKGGLDIWHAKLIDGKWQQLSSLPEPINSDKDDCFLQLSAAGDRLFFSSNRKGGLGGFDIYYSTRKSNSSPWEAPANIGDFINTSADEITFSVPTKGASIYAALGEKNQEDIFEFKLPEHLYPTSMVFLRGKILDIVDTQPIGNVKVKFESLTSTPHQKFALPQKFEFISEPSTGIFNATLFARQKYRINIQHEDYLIHTETLDLSQVSNVELLNKEIFLSSRPMNEKFAGVFFTNGSSQLDDEAKIALKLYLEFLLRHQDKTIVITGYADFTGGAKANQSLGLQRAQNVKKFLVENGIKEKNLLVKYGGVLGQRKDFYNVQKMHQYRTVEIKIP